MPWIDMPQYLDYLIKRLAGPAANRIHPVRSLTEAADAAPIVVNSPVSAPKLTGDDTLARYRPARFPDQSRSAATFWTCTTARKWTATSDPGALSAAASDRDRWDTTPDPEVTAGSLRAAFVIELGW